MTIALVAVAGYLSCFKKKVWKKNIKREVQIKPDQIWLCTHVMIGARSFANPAIIFSVAQSLILAPNDFSG